MLPFAPLAAAALATIPLPDGEVVVVNASRLPRNLQVLSRERMPVGLDPGTQPWKPWIVRLADGSLLMSFRTTTANCSWSCTHGLTLRRSRAAGAPGSWGPPQARPDLVYDGEGWMTALSDGVLLLGDGSGTLYRSATGQPDDLRHVPTPGAVPGQVGGMNCSGPTWSWECGSYGAVEVLRGSAANRSGGWPSGVYYFAASTVWHSATSGASWSEYVPAAQSWDPGQPLARGAHGFFAQSTVHLQEDGGLVHGTRWETNSTCDKYAGSQLWASSSRGRTWRCTTDAAAGFCATHTCPPGSAKMPQGWQHPACSGRQYPHFLAAGNHFSGMLRLERQPDKPVLLTWTHRTAGVQDDGWGTGVRASLSRDDGGSYDLSHDTIVLAAQDDDWAPCKFGSGCGGAWGNTIEMADGTLITVYTLSVGNVAPENPGLQRLGVLRWRLAPNTSTTLKTEDAQASSRLPDRGWSSWKLDVDVHRGAVLPTSNFSTRECSATWVPGPGAGAYLYCDIVSAADPRWPDSFLSSIGVFHSADGLRNWTYGGIVIPRGPAGSFDAGSAATPGAAYIDGKVVVSYTAEDGIGSPCGKMLSRFATLSVSLTPKASLLQGSALPSHRTEGSGRL